MKEKYKSVIILCGGRGTRLGSLGKKLPKTLDEQWLYYKKYYNTEKGKATHEHWLELIK